MTPKIGIVEAGKKFKIYKNAIEKHGGEVKELLVNGEQTVDEYIDQIHGLLLPGGKDINIDRAKDEAIQFIDGVVISLHNILMLMIWLFVHSI